MGSLLFVVRYFRVVPPVPRLMIASFLVLTMVGGVETAITGDREAAALVPVVVLQAFSVSTGFAAWARRGYFDLLIACGHSRTRIAAVQWMLSVAPGLCSWALLSIVHAVSHGSDNPMVRSGTALAFVMTSTIPWAVNVALPRFSGAIGWLLVVCTADSGGAIWPDSVRDVIFPLTAIGIRSPGIGLVAPGLLLSAGSMIVALWWIHHLDIRLEAAQ